MDGFVNFLKPPGMTSHDAVGYVRRQLGEKKVGHAGTLPVGAAVPQHVHADRRAQPPAQHAQRPV